MGRARHCKTQLVRAVKTICKPQMRSKERFRQEIAIMKENDHPNIIKLHETFEDFRNVYLVMEIAQGGDLFDRIIEVGSFSEKQAAKLMQQIAGAMNYLHKHDLPPRFEAREFLAHVEGSH